MAAACRLAGDGHEVIVCDRALRLGGRAAPFDQGGATIDRGHHVLMRACTAAAGFLERIGATDAVRFQESLAIPLLCDGERTVLRSWPLPGVVHLLPALLGYRPLDRRERLAVARAGVALLVPRSKGDGETFGQWLKRHSQSERAVRRLWDPIVVATLNAPASRVSFRAARHVFREVFFVPHGADMGLFTVPLDDVFQAARRYLEARGGTVELGVPVERVFMSGGSAHGIRLASGREIAGDAVIVAVPPDAFAELAFGIPELRPVVGAAQRLEWTPIVNVHLTFDRKVVGDAFAVGIDSLVQAIFAQADALTLGGASARGQTLVLSQSAAADWIDRSDEEIVSELRSALDVLVPAARGARLVDSLVLRHRRATFVPSPGADALRPKSRTPISGLYLAGDWTATGWPSTIESAVLSGIYAAAALESDAAARCPAAVESDAATCSKPESDIEKGHSEA